MKRKQKKQARLQLQAHDRPVFETLRPSGIIREVLAAQVRPLPSWHVRRNAQGGCDPNKAAPWISVPLLFFRCLLLGN
jgi:hypothetical protein